MAHLGASVVAIAIAAVTVSTAAAQNFDGITIIELDDREGAEAIVGGIPGTSHIVTFVSAAGTYAALTDENHRDCVAWAEAGSYTGDTIAFGLPRDEQRKASPRICLPFTLRLEGPGRVRVEAGEHYSRARRIVARAPLVAFDWGQPHFARHDIEGVVLGPVPAMQARLGASANIRIFPQPLANGAIYDKTMRVEIANPEIPGDLRTVDGRIATAESMGWPWDAIIRAEKTERLPQPSLIDAFERAVVARYGQATMRELNPFGTRVVFSWFYDVAGHPVDPAARGPDSCLPTRDLWEVAKDESDLGPWGCGLIFTVSHDGTRDFVRTFEIRAQSGYAAALSHFARRLAELQAVRERNDAIRSNPVHF
jgi:hypothetical protein